MKYNLKDIKSFVPHKEREVPLDPSDWVFSQDFVLEYSGPYYIPNCSPWSPWGSISRKEHIYNIKLRGTNTNIKDPK